MIKYDWNILSKLTHIIRMSVIFALASEKDLKRFPRSILEPISKFTDYTGFLINPYELINNDKKHTNSEIYLYLELAAMRSYINYKETGDLRLPTYYIKNRYDIDKLKLNTALIVTNEEILFIYEEN